MNTREDKPSARCLHQPEYRHAVELLLDIAGPASEHIRMNEMEGKKYYTNHEPLTLHHMTVHLDRRCTYGALIAHPDGATRASIYDADTPEAVKMVKEAARVLQASGYRPLIELSPVGKAHLVIIYTEHVNARAAHWYTCKLAPELEQITEYWPSPSRNKVRLPAGKYVRSGIAQWCKLYDAHGQELRVCIERRKGAILTKEPHDYPISSGKHICSMCGEGDLYGKTCTSFSCS